MVQSIGKTIWQFLEQLNIVNLYLRNCTLGIYTREIESCVQMKICSQMFPATLFLIAQTEKNPIVHQLVSE